MSEALFGELAALGAAVCWAVAPILYRQALFHASPFSANIVRCATNAAVMVAVLVALGWAESLARLPLSVIAITVVSGFVGLFVGDTMYLYGLRSLGVSRAVPLAASYPLFSLIWAALLGQPVTAVAVLGAVVILFGIWLLSRGGSDATVHLKSRLVVTGVAICLLTAVVWSVSVTLMDVAVSLPGVVGADANFAVVTVRIASVAVLFLALSPLLDRSRGFLKVQRGTLLQLLIGGLVANALGWFLMNYSFLNIAESQAVPISSTTPLFSAIAGFALFREKMTFGNTVGAAVVVAGIALLFIV
ncbi:MAG: DMT family transporter [Candidatus Bathyarchaeia archaeon]